MEVNAWAQAEDEISLSFGVGHEVSGEAFLYLPKPPIGVWIDGQPQVLAARGQGMYALVLDNADGAAIKIKY